MIVFTEYLNIHLGFEVCVLLFSLFSLLQLYLSRIYAKYESFQTIGLIHYTLSYYCSSRGDIFN